MKIQNIPLLIGVAILLSSCTEGCEARLTLPPEIESISINGEKLPKDTLSTTCLLGETLDFEIVITDDHALGWASVSSSSSFFSVSKRELLFETKDEFTFSLLVSENAPSGSHIGDLYLEYADESIDGEIVDNLKKATFRLFTSATDTSSPIDIHPNVIMAGQVNTDYGHFFGLETDSVYSVEDIFSPSNHPEVDMVFYVDEEWGPVLMSPHFQAIENIYPFIVEWNTRNETLFKPVTTSTPFSSIQDQQFLRDAWNNPDENALPFIRGLSKHSMFVFSNRNGRLGLFYMVSDPPTTYLDTITFHVVKGE